MLDREKAEHIILHHLLHILKSDFLTAEIKDQPDDELKVGEDDREKRRFFIGTIKMASHDPSSKRAEGRPNQKKQENVPKDGVKAY